MSLFKQAWKLLTEDPSKDISKKSKSIKDIKKEHPNAYSTWSKEDDLKLSKLYKEGKTNKELSIIFERTEGAIEARIEKLDLSNQKEYKKSLSEKLYELKHKTFMSQDVSIKDINVEYKLERIDRTYYSGYRYDDYKKYRSENQKYDITLVISGRTIFDRLVPLFPGLSEREIMGREGNDDYTTGVMTVDNQKSKVKKINVVVSVWDKEGEISDLFADDTTLYESRIKSISVIRQDLKGRITVRDITNNRSNRMRSSSTNLNDVIFGYNELLKKQIESDFELEIDQDKKEKELKKVISGFNDNINQDLLSDLFAYSSDISNGADIKLEEDKNIRYNYQVKGVRNFYTVKFNIDQFSENGVFKLTGGGFSNLLIEIGEAVNRLNDIHGCNSEMKINDNDIKITIKPNYPNWLITKGTNKRTRRDRRNHFGELEDLLYYG